MTKELFLKLFKVFTALALSLTTALGTGLGITPGKPIKATRQDYSFDNQRLLIGGYNFDLSLANEEQVNFVKEAGIDFLITNVREDFLDMCAQKGIGIIAKNYNANAMYGHVSNTDRWFGLSAQNYKDHPALWGDDLIDEPDSPSFEALNEICAHYYNTAKGKIPLINLFPIYANSEQLGNEESIPLWKKVFFYNTDFSSPGVDRYKRHVSDYINKIDTDYISVDIYPLHLKRNALGDLEKDTYGLWLRNLDILAEACRATDRDLWVITQAAGNTAGEESGMRYADSPADIRWQAYAGLAFGAKAIIHACYSGGWWDRDSHLIDAEGNRTDTYYAAQKVDEELKSFAKVYGSYDNKGAYLLNDTFAAGAQYKYFTPVSDRYKPQIKSADPILVGCFDAKDSASKAFVLVNMHETRTNLPANLSLKVPGASKLTVYQAGKTITFLNDGSCSLSLSNGEGVFIIAK